MNKILLALAVIVSVSLAGCAGTMKGESAVATEISPSVASTVVARSLVQKCDSAPMLLDLSDQEAPNAASAFSKDPAAVKEMIRKMAAAQRGLKSAPDVDPKPIVLAALKETECFTIMSNTTTLAKAKRAQEYGGVAGLKSLLAPYSVIPNVLVTQEGLSQQELMNRAVGSMGWLAIGQVFKGNDTKITDKATVSLTLVNNKTFEEVKVEGVALADKEFNMARKSLGSGGGLQNLTDTDKRALVKQATIEAVNKLVSLVKGFTEADRKAIEPRVAKTPSTLVLPVAGKSQEEGVQMVTNPPKKAGKVIKKSLATSM